MGLKIANKSLLNKNIEISIKHWLSFYVYVYESRWKANNMS